MRLQQSLSEKLSKLPPWVTNNLDRAMAIVSVASLGLVLFDLSYVPWRDFYWQKLPAWLPAQLPIRDLASQYDRGLINCMLKRLRVKPTILKVHL